MGICKLVPLQVGDDIFHADFYTIPLEGFDVILGVKWSCTLGTNFMGFQFLDNEICPRREADLVARTTVKGKTMTQFDANIAFDYCNP